MRDTTPGGVRQVAARNEIRHRETDRSARRVGAIAGAAARGVIAYAERTTGNVTLAADTEKIIIPGLVVPVEQGRQYRVAVNGNLWTDGTTPGRGNLQVRLLLSADGTPADLTSTFFDFARIHTIANGYGTSGETQRMVPPIDGDQYAYLSVALSAIAAGRTGGVEGTGPSGARLLVFDEGAAIGAAADDGSV